MNKKEIKSKKLGALVKELYAVLNLMSLVNLVLLLILAIIALRTGLFNKGGNLAVISLTLMAIFLWYGLKSQYKKIIYKSNLGKTLSEEQWQLLNTEMDRPSTRYFGNINNMNLIILTKSFILFPSKRALEIFLLNELVSVKKRVNRTKNNQEAKSYLDLETRSRGKYTLNFHEELFQRLRHLQK